MLVPRDNEKRFLIIGHSFVSRLSDFIHNYFGEPRVNGKKVQFIGVRGADVDQLRDRVSQELDAGVVAVHIEIGSNDLATPRRVADVLADIIGLIRWLTHRSISQISVGEILFRKRVVRHLPMSLADYNRRVLLTNRHLRIECQNCHVKFCHDRGIRDKLCDDGVHLTDEGQKLLWKEIVHQFTMYVDNDNIARVSNN